MHSRASCFAGFCLIGTVGISFAASLSRIVAVCFSSVSLISLTMSLEELKS
jgi:hypothetical protein